MKKRLYKSRYDKKLEGVCAGIASFLNLDPTLVRAIYALVTIFSAGIPGVIAYIVLAAIMPVEPDDEMPAQ
ncbi:MAG TPA: PspC domain-containing protein [Clostridia bacterium]|nr:PspC domain-containing protein [Clostridia bacterium]